MYAVIKTGGKQYRVAEGDKLVVEKIEGEAGDVVAFDQVLMIGDDKGVAVGEPVLEGAQVTAELVELRKGKKIKVFKKRRRQNYRRKKGHRQWEALVAISEIVRPGETPKTKASAKPKPAAETKGAEAKPAAAGGAKPKAAAKAATPKAAAPKAAEASAAKDDLKALTGIGPALETKLNEAGVTAFAQIAAWTEADLAALEEKVPGVTAKAEKGGWIAEAKDKAGA